MSHVAVFVLSLVTLAGQAHAAAPQYLIHLKCCELSADGRGPVKVLAEPVLATVENRPSKYQVGGEQTLGDQRIEFGTAMDVSIHAANDGAVTLRGRIEVSAIEAGDADLVVRQATAVHFNRRVALGKSTQFKVRGARGGTQTFDVRIEKVTARPPAALPVQAQSAAPR